MEKIFDIVPFDVDVAKQIASGKLEGQIITRVGGYVRSITFDIKRNLYPISAVVETDVNTERVLAFTNEGTFYLQEKTDDWDLMLKVPKYKDFMDGDVIAFGEKYIFIGIYKQFWKYNKSHTDYVTLTDTGKLIFNGNGWTFAGSRKASDEEIQELINALKKSEDPRAKESLKLLGIKQDQEHEFNPFDKVLVRQCSEDKWEAMLFSNYTDKIHKYRCCGMNYMYCIPYNEKTAHLLGSTENWEG